MPDELTLPRIKKWMEAFHVTPAMLAQAVGYSKAHMRKVLHGQPLLDIVQDISGAGGGTSLFAPIQWAFTQGKRYDTAIFLTDSESWVEELGQRGGTRSRDLIRAYRQQVNPALVCVFVQIAPYAHSVVPMSEPNTYFVSGWSDAVLSAIGLWHNGATLLDTVRAVKID